MAKGLRDEGKKLTDERVSMDAGRDIDRDIQYRERQMRLASGRVESGIRGAQKTVQMNAERAMKLRRERSALDRIATPRRSRGARE